MRPTSKLLFLTLAMALTACAHEATPPLPTPKLNLTITDTEPAPDPERPEFGDIEPPKPTGAQERAYLFAEVIRPLMAFSVAQEAATASERQRAEGIEAKVGEFNAAQDDIGAIVDPPPPRWQFWKR